MRKNTPKSLILFIIALLFFSWLKGLGFAQYKFPPSLDWFSIKTKHFRIHYSKELGEIARKFAPMAEKIHERLSRTMNWQPFFRTDVILVDNMDLPNGFASPFPYNRIQLFISRPPMDSVLHNFYDWLELLFTHEYTHILSMDINSGIPGIFRKTIGRYYFPNTFIPIWILEGYAVYSESNYQLRNKSNKAGRLNSAYVDMIFRMDFLSNKGKSLDQASIFIKKWPAGNIPYIYGGDFIQYVEDSYRDHFSGKSSFANIFHVSGNNLIPFVNNKNARDVYNGITFDTLWEKWLKSERQKYLKQKKNIEKTKITSLREITESGYNTYLARFSRSGKNIIYIRQNNSDKTSLVSHDIQTGREKNLATVNIPLSFTETHNGKIYVSDIEVTNSFSFFNDIFIYDPDGFLFPYQKITKAFRPTYIDYSPGIDKFVLIKKNSDKYSLVLSDRKFEKINILIKESASQLAFCRISPDGKKIIFTVRNANGKTSLTLYDIKSQKFFTTGDSNSNNITPSWNPLSDKIVYASDRTGVFNLYEISLATKRERRLTNLLGGAFKPDVSPDGKKILFANYGTGGFNIALMPYPEKSNRNNATIQLREKYFNKAKVTNKEEQPESGSGPYQGEPYSPWHSIPPSFWWPIIGTEEIYDNRYDNVFGFSIFGTDTLFKHSFDFSLFAYQRQERLGLNFNYTLDLFFPTIQFGYRDDAIFWGNDQVFDEIPFNSALMRITGRSGYIQFTVPFLFIQYQHIFNVSFSYGEVYQELFYLTSGSQDKSELTKNRLVFPESGINLLYYFSNTAFYTYSISPENGFSVLLSMDQISDDEDFKKSYSLVEGVWGNYLPFIWENHILALVFLGGTVLNGPAGYAPYSLGRYESGTNDSYNPGLRGYVTGLIFGQSIATAKLEYRFPLFQVDFGYSTLPVHFRNLWLVLFGEAGKIWGEEYSFLADDTKLKYQRSAGVEIHMTLTLVYQMALEGYVGFARGFDPGGEDQIYFAVGTSYTGTVASGKNRFLANKKW